VGPDVSGDVPSRPFGDASEFAWAPDGKSLILSARKADREEPWSTNFDLYQVRADGTGTAKNLTASNKAWDTGPVFSQDGKTLYYRAMKRPGFEADRFALMALDLASGKAREIDPKWDASANGITLSDDGKTIYTTAQELGQEPLFAVDVASGDVTTLVKDGSVTAFAMAGPTLVYTRNSLQTGDQLFAAQADGSTPRPITQSAGEMLPDVKFGGRAAVQVHRLEQRNGARLRREAVELPAGQEVSGGLPHPRRPAGQLRQRLELSLESADLCRPGLRGGHDRLPRFDRLRPGLHRCNQPALGRSPAGRPAEGLGRGAAAVRLPRRRQGVRARRVLRRLHGQLDRRQLETNRGSAW
jgi:dipeptidyl aminopeptidase/acylaminoacyl peptidase